MKRFAGAAMDVENLRKALDQIKTLRAELNNSLQALESSREQAASFKGRLTEAVSISFLFFVINAVQPLYKDLRMETRKVVLATSHFDGVSSKSHRFHHVSISF